MNKIIRTSAGRILALILLSLVPVAGFPASELNLQDFTRHSGAIACIIIFVLAYSLVIAEETIHLRKSKPVMVAAGIIWCIVAVIYSQAGDTHTAEAAVRHNLLEFAELFLFLLAAMTYINTMEERGVFDLLRAWLVSRGYSLRKIFWLTGAISFVLSPIADNLTTALLMSTVAMSVGGANTAFVAIACINIVVAANAGGAFSPFGDITTLMVWQKGGLVEFSQFFYLVVPSLVNWLIPATIMSFTVPKQVPEVQHEQAKLKEGAWIVVGLFIVTIVMAVSAHSFLHLPPVIGMMTGLGFLKFFGYYLKMKSKRVYDPGAGALGVENFNGNGSENEPEHLDIFKKLARAEWDTLMFFYGVILCVGGLGALGYLGLVSEMMYVDLGATRANILVGFLSAIIDNIPVMFAVLTMLPEMDLGQWLLVTLTAGVGGSMLSVGSAAGVAVMGQARGVYTFFSHLKWSWAIMIGYFASIWVHFLVNGNMFTG
ncbi:MAG: sodium:proton antiporter NhaD [Gammaproteobacteria bacterium]|nr:sodium:proton antiporter NhaD [Gammaproteobacteria bacterium]